MIDIDGFRIGVGIIVCNQQGEVLWAKRIGQSTWQFPQGGVQAHETPEVALYRELHEELGLHAIDVKLLAYTKNWLSYWLPVHLRRTHMKPLCIGQKQKWFLLQLINENSAIRFDCTNTPEFDRWRWVDYWYPLQQVISFKRYVYRQALEELIEALPQLSQSGN